VATHGGQPELCEVDVLRQLAFERFEQRAQKTVDRLAEALGSWQARLHLAAADHLFHGAAVALDVHLDLVEQSGRSPLEGRPRNRGGSGMTHAEAGGVGWSCSSLTRSRT